MMITSTQASQLIGRDADTYRLLKHDALAADQMIELDTADPESSREAVGRLSSLSAAASSPQFFPHDFNVSIHIENTPEGMSAAQALLSNMGHVAMAAPSVEHAVAAGGRPPITFMPTAGGMALGCAGGVGLGLALEALRSTANGAGNPVLGGLAIGLGLLGTAIGGAAGATGTLPKIKIPKVGELSFEKIG